MYEALLIGSGFISALILLIIIVSKYLTITRVSYTIVLRGEGNERKVLNSFQRFYWKLKSADKDIEELQAECELIRSDYVGGKDFLLSLINENFEIDYKQVHLENRKDTIKPKWQKAPITAPFYWMTITFWYTFRRIGAYSCLIFHRAYLS